MCGRKSADIGTGMVTIAGCAVVPNVKSKVRSDGIRLQSMILTPEMLSVICRTRRISLTMLAGSLVEGAPEFNVTGIGNVPEGNLIGFASFENLIFMRVTVKRVY